MDETNINLSELKVDLPDNCDDTPEEKRCSAETSVEALDDQSMEDDDSEYLEAVSSGEENVDDDDDDDMIEMLEDCVEGEDDEEESSDDEELLQVALMIDSSQVSKDTDRLPINGHDYLRQVQLERQKYPAVSYAKPPPPKSRQDCPPSPWVELLLSKSNRGGQTKNSEQS